jgi:hypothetical protein
LTETSSECVGISKNKVHGSIERVLKYNQWTSKGIDKSGVELRDESLENRGSSHVLLHEMLSGPRFVRGVGPGGGEGL